MIRVRVFNWAVFSFLGFFVNVLAAVEVTRGPYLNRATPSEITVKWRTDVQTDSVVRYGTSPNNLDQIAQVSGSGRNHRVKIRGLAQDTVYYYSVGSSSETIAGGDSSYRFATSPAPGTEKPTRVWIIGDSGTANSNARRVYDAYLNYPGADQTNLWLMLGDNAYDDGRDSEYQAAVFDMYPELLRRSTLWSTLGNHDGRSADSDNLSGVYYDIFSLPRSGEAGGLASGTEAYYSFDYGNIHFVCLDSYDSDRSKNGAMLTWLENDLASTQQKWIVAFFHHPPYSKGSHDTDNEDEYRSFDMRENALPILEQYGVDLVLSGHSHSYERSFLIDGHYGRSNTFASQNKVDGGSGRADGSGAYRKEAFAPNAGAIYTVAGASGKTSGVGRHPAMYAAINELGSVVLDINGDRLDMKYLSDTGNVLDYFSILKGDATGGNGGGDGNGSGSGGTNNSGGDTPTATNSLTPNSRMDFGDRLVSTNGAYRLTFQSDGNLVLRDSSGSSMWSSKTHNQGADRFVFQGDSNLVIYNPTSALWASGTNGDNADRLVLNNNGSLVLYRGDTVVWFVGNNPPTGDGSGGGDGSTGGGGDGDGSTGGGTGGTSIPQPVGSTANYSSNDRLNISAPSERENGDLLMLFLSRTDDLLPTRLSGWDTAAACFKTTNGQNECHEVPDCTDRDGDYCLRFDGGNGRDLATVVFTKPVTSGDNSSYSFNLRGSKPSWAIMTAVRGADLSNPIRDVATESNDGSADSLFPSVYGETNDLLLLSMAFDDTAQRDDFQAPDGMTLVDWTRGSDEAGFLYSERLSSNGQTGSRKTRGPGGPNAKDALISLTVRAGQDDGNNGGSDDSTRIQRSIDNGNDDVEQRTDGSMYSNSSDIELVNDNGDQIVGLRFNNLTIPQNAVIKNAYLQFTADETNSGATVLQIRAHAADNAPVFGTTSNNLSQRNLTSTSVSWSPAAWNSVGESSSAQRTPSLSGVIQQIVNRSGWNSGNSIAFVISGSGERTAESFEGSSSNAAKLIIEYTDPVVVVDSTPPTLTLQGESEMTINVGDTFTDPGVIATDDVDGNITSRVQVQGSVNSELEGTYSLTYRVSDTAGNQATPLTRTIIVAASGGGNGGDTPTSSNSLQPSSRLDFNARLTSSNGNYRLYFQTDGNLVLRDINGNAIWSSGTHNQGGDRFVFQSDGNLVIYAGNNPLWDSGTNGDNPDRLVLNNNGSLVLYRGNTVVWSVGNPPPTGGDDGSTGGGDDGSTGGGDDGSTGGGDDGSTGGETPTTGLNRFSTPEAALYSLNDKRPRGFPRVTDTNFNGNGHSVTWDGRLFVVKRSQGWFAAAFRPERIVRNNDGTVDFTQGAFGSTLLMLANEDAPDMQVNWLAIVIDPTETRENPYPSDARGNYLANGTYRTYKALVYHTSKRNGDNDQMGYQRATFVVSNGNTRDAQVVRADFTTEFQRFRTVANLDFRCIEPSATIDGRLVICQGHPDNNGRIDNLVYSWNPTPGGVTGWSVPKSIANMYWDDRNTMVDGIPFAIRYPVAERPLLDQSGNDYNPNELVKGAYPWVSRDGSEIFYQASREGVSARRTATTVVGRWTGWTFRHIDGPINPMRSKSRLFLSSPGAFTTMWSPFKDVDDLKIPYSTRGPSYPIIGSNSRDYSEVSFDDYLDGHFVLYYGMNEQVDRSGSYQVTKTNDTSGNFNNGTLVGAKFPKEFNDQDTIVGRYGQAIYFNSGDYIDVDKAKGWDSIKNEMTIDFYVQVRNASGRVSLFEMQNGAEVFLRNGSGLSAAIEDVNGIRYQVDGTNIPTNRWVHIAFTFNAEAKSLALYVDGKRVANRVLANVANVRNDGRVRIGPVGSSALLLLDEMKVSNVTRKPYEIAHYANVRIDNAASGELMAKIPNHFRSLRFQASNVEGFSEEAATLGSDLFSDVILSKNRTTSCATCHNPELKFTDGLAIAKGNEPTDAGFRNTPTLVNRLFSTFQAWDGSANTLDTQASVPITAEHEMNLSIEEAITRLTQDPSYNQRFQSVFGTGPTEANLNRALAAFQVTQFSERTRVDDYLSGKRNALSAAEERGLRLFNNKARCSGCHAGANFTDESFRQTGIVENNDLGRAISSQRERDHRLFKVPTLRNLAFTAPYMHDGSIATLREVVQFYNLGAPDSVNKDTDIRPLELSEQEMNDLVSFLNALSSPSEGDSSGGGTNPPTGDDEVTTGNSLQSNQRLNVGEQIESSNGAYRLTMQTDGNLVLYTSNGSPVWASGTNGTAATRVTLQGDGNLVIRDAGGAAVWSSKTAGSGVTRLTINNDGRLGLYAGAQLISLLGSD
ncbi:MAG: DUF5011 domain-containing protein [Gammaproteobacteria bacterium]|nr:DUF5011 domain-containing protein [Gammaproteobacteria bacterium]